MKKRFWGFIKKNYIYIIMVALVVLRLLLGKALGGWFGINETLDDMAMMHGLSAGRLTDPSQLALIKDLSFSLFLGFSAVTGLPYTIVLSAFWAATAWVVWLLAGKVTKNRWVRLFAFAYVLFLPIAFTSWGGLRIYRNAIIAPAIILTFSLLLLGLVNVVRGERLKKSVWVAVTAGLVFAFSYYLKEDGIWMMACLAVLLVVEFAVLFYKRRKDKKKWGAKRVTIWALVCLIPFLAWFGWTNIYKGVNHAFFGVYETNTRTRGELGKFVEKIYKIDSPNRTNVVWAPADAIQAAFKASPTLAAQPQLLDEIMTAEAQSGDILADPIRYDFLTWIIRTELVDVGLWTSEIEVSNMFKQVNAELDEAFKNGTLKKAEGRIQLLASTGGYTWEEIKNSDMLLQVGMSLEDSIWLTRYDAGFDDDDVFYGTKGKEWDYGKVNKVLHMSGDVNVVAGREGAKTVAEVVFWVYRIVNSGLVVIMIGFIAYEIVMLGKNWKKKLEYLRKNGVAMSCAAVSLMFLGVTIVYSLATAWFFNAPLDSIGYLPEVFVFYRVGVPGLFTIAMLAATIGAAKHFLLLGGDDDREMGYDMGVMRMGVWRKMRKQCRRNRNKILFNPFYNKRKFVVEKYTEQMGRIPELERPTTFTEKLNALKLNEVATKAYWKYADKHAVRKYVKKKIGNGYLIPEYLYTTHLSMADFEALPESFVLKTTSGSGTNYIVRDKEGEDLKGVAKYMNFLKTVKYGYLWGEFLYNNVKPGIVVEKLLTDDDGNIPDDLKCFCFKDDEGVRRKVLYVERVIDNERYRIMFDENWSPVNYGCNFEKLDIKLKKPRNYKEILRAIDKLSEDFDFVRVDLFLVGEKIYFGELTFVPTAGYMKFTDDKIDALWGSWISSRGVFGGVRK